MSKLTNAIDSLASKGAVVTANLQKACVLVTLRVHRWRGTEQAKGASVTLCEKHIDSRTLPPKWRLIPQKWNKVFGAIETSARALIHAYSVRSPIQGSRFIPIANADTLFKECTALKERMKNAADEFCTDEVFEEIKAELVEDLGTHAGSVAISALPSPSEARSKFGMDWFVVPIGNPEAAITDNASVYVKEAQATLNKVVMESIEAMLREPRAKLLTAVSALASQLVKTRRSVREASLESIKRAFEEYRSWGFLSDDKTLEALQTVERELSSTTNKSINTEEEVAKTLVQSLKDLSVIIKDEEGIMEGFGKFKRAINID